MKKALGEDGPINALVYESYGVTEERTEMVVRQKCGD